MVEHLLFLCDPEAITMIKSQPKADRDFFRQGGGAYDASSRVCMGRARIGATGADMSQEVSWAHGLGIRGYQPRKAPNMMIYTKTEHIQPWMRESGSREL